MRSISDIFRSIQDITHLEQKTLEQLALKTCEESGELAQAVLSYTKAPGCAYKAKTRVHVDFEAVDVIICAAATLFKDSTSPTPETLESYLCDLFETKLQKWKDAIAKERK